MLRLVKEEPPKSKRRKGAKPPLALTAEQQAKVRAALKNLCHAYGGWEVLAGIFEMSGHVLCTIASGKRPVTGEVLIRACRAGGLSVDAMLGEPLSDTGRCRACGAMRRAS